MPPKAEGIAERPRFIEGNVMMHLPSNSEAIGVTFIVGDPESWSLADLARAATARGIDASEVLARLLVARQLLDVGK